MTDENTQTLLRFFKALSDESRLKIVGILATRECSVEELAGLLTLKEPTVAHHLGKLRELELVHARRQGAAAVYSLKGDVLRRMNRELLATGNLNALDDDAAPRSRERSVLSNFLDGERLKQVPVTFSKRLVVLQWLADKFEPGLRYPEADVNEIIKRHHPDYAWLRRELVDNGFMQREAGVYWRAEG
jgi:DNA-binding transcriptional ArsR family regulator